MTFQHDLRAEQTRAFEHVYEENLQLEDEDKNWILDHDLAVWLLVDGQLAGESYGILVADDEEAIEDTIAYPDALYCYSTTILPAFQGRGLGRILKAHWLGWVWAKHPLVPIVGHSTSPAMVKINEEFGAQHGVTHERWYDTDRVAHFYVLKP